MTVKEVDRKKNTEEGVEREGGRELLRARAGCVLMHQKRESLEGLDNDLKQLKREEGRKRGRRGVAGVTR